MSRDEQVGMGLNNLFDDFFGNFAPIVMPEGGASYKKAYEDFKENRVARDTAFDEEIDKALDDIMPEATADHYDGTPEGAFRFLAGSEDYDQWQLREDVIRDHHNGFPQFWQETQTRRWLLFPMMKMKWEEQGK